MRGESDTNISILDCHAHFLDAQLHTYPIFQQRSAGFESLVGDYSGFPRRYLPAQYLKDIDGLNVAGIVCAEFISTDPLREAQWLDGLCTADARVQGVIAVADFLDPDVESVLRSYRRLQHVKVVRQHLAWHPDNPALRFAARPDVLRDKFWRKNLALVRKHDLHCEIEIFAPQLSDFTDVASAYPDIQFILPLMGWPIDLSEAGHRDWKADMKTLSRCENVAVKIFGLECIFGLRWTLEQVRPWILDTLELFGPDRCMFASHMPIALLACSFRHLYSAYFEVVAGFSAPERRKIFHDTAARIYELASPSPLWNP
jgi:predicted TIM-barrel fold metal-dependent hydrolase